jgi:hypothetical protein
VGSKPYSGETSMDYNMVSAEEFGKSLTGLGVNIIVKKP